MKKLLFFVIAFLVFSPVTKAFLGDDLGINLFENINKWVEELELKQYEFELSWQWESIIEYFNPILKAYWLPECLEKELSIEEVDLISNWDINLLTSKLSEDCKSNDWSVSSNTIVGIQKTINEINELTKFKSTEKAKRLNNISRVWIYSDWNVDNSPFDLYTDLQDIDYYIFTEEIPYNWELLENNDEIMSDIIDDLVHPKNLINSNWNNSSYLAQNSTNNLWDISINTENWTQEIESNYNCIDNTKNAELSWLNEDQISELLNPSNTEVISEIIEEIPYIENENKNLLSDKNTSWSYKKLNDNSQFPCTTFFCITVDFITYQHNLLGWWETFSIEHLISRSNEHLKKFVATSLIQALDKPVNFEFNLKDLNLPDMFHVWINISNMPVPILDIELDEEKEDKTKYTKENLLEEYYKWYWLERSRRNDISIFDWEYDEIKSVLDLAEIWIWQTWYKLLELSELNAKELEQIDLLEESVYQKVINDDLGDFWKRFIELRNFTNSMKEKADQINSIVRFLNKIPIDKW